MRKRFITVLVLLLTISFFGCSNSNQQDPVEEVEKIGGELVIYTPNSDREVEVVIPYFEEKYGVTVTTVIAGVDDCAKRIKDEAEKPECDVLWGGMTYTVYQNYPDLWEEYISLNDENITEKDFKNTTGYFTRYCLFGNSPFVVNVEGLAEVGLTIDDIKGYQDLIDHADKLKGKVLIGDPTGSESAYSQVKSMIYLFGEGEHNDWANRDYTNSWEFLKKFIDVIDGKVMSASTAVYKGVQEGDALVGLTNEVAVINLLKQGVQGIEIVYPEEGCSWTAYGASIVKNAPHMEQAKAFIDFLISEECQKIYAKTSLRPILTGINNDDERMPALDEVNLFIEDREFTFTQRKEWMSKWNQLMKEHKK